MNCRGILSGPLGLSCLLKFRLGDRGSEINRAGKRDRIPEKAVRDHTIFFIYLKLHDTFKPICMHTYIYKLNEVTLLGLTMLPPYAIA